MKRLFLSDLHVGDGTAKDDFEFDEEFVKLLETFEAEDVELIINGDFLEISKSRRLKKLGLVPLSVVFERLEPEVVDDIVLNHERLFKKLAEFAKKKKVYYVVGNHDFYMLKMDKLRRRFWELLGVRIPICSHVYLDDWKILVFHGHQFDVTNRLSFDAKSRELLPPLGDYAARYMTIHFDDLLYTYNVPEDILKNYDNVKPATDTVKWLEYVSKAYNVGLDLVEEWTKTFVKMLKTPIAKRWMKVNYPLMNFFSNFFINNFGGLKLGEYIVRAVDKLRRLRQSDVLYKRSKKVLIRKRGKVFKKKDLVGFDEEMLEYDSRDVNGLILGHSHYSDLRFFKRGGDTTFYLNTGTWWPVVSKRGKVFHRICELTWALIDDSKGKLEIELHTRVRTIT